MNSSAFLMTLSSLLFAFMGVCVRFASQTLPVSEIVLFRSVIGLVLIVPWMLLKKDTFIGYRPTLLITRGITGFLALSLYFFAISKIPLATAVMLNYTSPLFVAMLAPFVLKEKTHWKIFATIFLGLLGVILIVHPKSNVNLVGAILGLVSGVFAAMAYLAIGALRKNHSSFTIVFYFFWVSTALGIPISWASFRIPNFSETLYLLGTGVFATIAQILMTQAYQKGSTATTSAYSTSIVLFSMILGEILWNETLGAISLIGGGLIVFSIVIISRLEKTEALTTD